MRWGLPKMQILGCDRHNYGGARLRVRPQEGRHRGLTPTKFPRSWE